MLRLLVIAIAAMALPSNAHAERVVAVAPLSTLGVEDKSATTAAAIAQIESAIATLPDHVVISTTNVSVAIDRAKQPQLKVCDRDAACLSRLGKLVGAHIVISGEIGGLGDAQVIYLSATDVAAAKDLRSTTFAVGANDADGGPAGAIVRLLDPGKYLGTLQLAIDVPGATVFINGAKATLTRGTALALPVGTHALRVTHPHYRDFIKFVSVPYGRPLDVAVVMARHPIVEHDVQAAQHRAGAAVAVEPPLYRRWYVAGPALLALSIGAGFAVAALAHDFPAANACRAAANESCGK